MSTGQPSDAELRARRRLLLRRSDRLRRRIASEAVVLEPALAAADKTRAVLDLLRRHRAAWLGAAVVVAGAALRRPSAAARLGRGALAALELGYGGRALLRRASRRRR